MTAETKRSQWTSTKTKLKSRFRALSAESLEAFKGNLGLLSAKLQSVYGYAKAGADREYSGFKATVHSATEPKKTKNQRRSVATKH